MFAFFRCTRNESSLEQMQIQSVLTPLEEPQPLTDHIFRCVALLTAFNQQRIAEAI